MLPMRFAIALRLAFLFVFGSLGFLAAEKTGDALPKKAELPSPVIPNAPVENSVAALTNTQFRVIAPGEFELGKIRLSKGNRTVSFPASLNRAEGPMEYFLVSNYGKTHESILRTDVKPYDIHVAMLLLGAVGSRTNRLDGNSTEELRSQISNPSKEPLSGDRVTIQVTWTEKGNEVKRSARELIYNEETRASPEDVNWTYNGSLIVRGKFLAQIEGSIVSLVTDPIALVNNTGSGHDNDHIWSANTNNLPPSERALQVTIKLEGVTEKK